MQAQMILAIITWMGLTLSVMLGTYSHRSQELFARLMGHGRCPLRVNVSTQPTLYQMLCLRENGTVSAVK